MPLLDHFRPPVTLNHSWESFHSNWATRIADALNDRLPSEFLAEEQTHAGGRLEIDVAAYEHSTPPSGSANGAAVATARPAICTPPAPPLTVPFVLPDAFEVRVYSTTSGLTLVGVIELVSPGNKDRPEERQAFAAKAAGLLHQGVSLIVVDAVTTRSGNLHNETVRLIGAGAHAELPADADLYAVAYRPATRGEAVELDIWPERLALGRRLPTLPLRLTGDLFVPVELETSYTEACRRRRLIP